MLLNEMSTQLELKDCASIRGVDGLNRLQLCFDYHSESDLDVFDKNMISQLFGQNVAHIQVDAKKNA